jgi:deoxycytidylate deaminase
MARTPIATSYVSQQVDSPELFIGLVGAAGTELDKLTTLLSDSLEKVRYSASLIRLAQLLRAVPRYRDLPTKMVDEYLDSHMTAGDDFRTVVGQSDAVALLGIGEIIELRKEAGRRFGDIIPRRTYIIRSLKNPEEAKMLRRVYGSSFYLIAAYSPYHQRRNYLAKRIARSRNKFPFELHFPVADYLMLRDQEELDFSHGQNTRNTFHLADVFLDTSDQKNLPIAVNRFVELLFGNTFHTPTRAEYGMFHAQAAALRSAELGRQVGAAVLTAEGDIVSVGTNEVPKAGGGLYWSEDEPDKREFREGFDSNDEHKRNLIAETIGYLQKGRWLAPSKARLDLDDLVDLCLDENKPLLPKDSKIRNLIEFGRAVHAESAALNDAARRGVSVAGCNMYVTTFPCHLCARQIVAAGIRKVFYIEPYAKSLAAELYPDSILVDGAEKNSHQVPFEPFVGVSPRQYMNLFSKTKRKTDSGKAILFKAKDAKLRYYDLSQFYLENEDKMVKTLGDKFKKKIILKEKMDWRPDAIRRLALKSNR